LLSGWRRWCFRLGLGFGHGLGQLRLQQLLVVEQVAKRQLIFAGAQLLGLGAVDPALEQLVFVRQVDDGLLQRRVARVAFGQPRFDAQHLTPERRDQRGEIVRRKLGFALRR
jgi:hypothetical protein